jgi:hypothetical protein
MKKLFFIIFAALTYSTTIAEVRFVSKTGSSTPPFTTWTTAADSIQKCINISSFGDTIYVGEGTYREFVRMGEGLSLIGTGYDNCTIDGRTFISNTTDELIIMKDSCLISGFKIIVSNYNPAISSYDGHAISAYTDSVSGNYTTIIKNNLITQAYFGIRTNIIDANVIENIISNCRVAIIFSSYFLPMKFSVFSNIIHTTGTGVSSGIGSISKINNNVFYLEERELTTASRSNGELDFYNNLIISETYNSIGAINSSFRTNIINNTLIGHFWRGIGVHDNNVIKNNVLTNGRRGIENESINTTIQYNCLSDFETIAFPNPLDSTNIIADPMFVDTLNENYYLQMFSPCINSGDPAILDVDGSRSDMGVYGGPFGESYTYQDLAPKPPRNLTLSLIDTNQVNLNWLPNTEADFYLHRVYRDTVSNFIYNTTKIIAVTSDSTFTELLPSNQNSYYYKITAIDSQYNQSPASEEAAVLVVDAEEPKLIANDYQFYPNYPNPFNPATKLSYRLKDNGTVRLVVYDIKGELIEELINEYQQAGYYEVDWNAEKRKLSSGIYLFRIEVKNENNIPVFSDMRKSILVK